MALTNIQIERIRRCIEKNHGQGAAQFAQSEAAKHDGIDAIKRKNWLRVLDAIRESKIQSQDTVSKS